MYCNNCGKELQAGGQFCGSCGQPVGVAPVPSSINRVAENVHLLSIFWLIYGILELLGGIVVMVVAQTIFGFLFHLQGMNQQAPPAFVGSLLTGIAFFVLAKGAICTLAGVGLMQRQTWARMLSLVMGILSLFNIPFGTALGIYTMWVFLPEGAGPQYEALARA